jgi:hypothetical protein
MNEIEALLYTVRKRESLELIVKIHENDGHAALALDLAALRSVVFAGGVAEFIYSYTSYLAGNEQELPYSNADFREFEREFFGEMTARKSSWRDLYSLDQDFCFEIFRKQLTRRNGGHEAVASGDILHLELARIWKENPSCRQILAGGAVGAILFLAGTFGWVHVQKTNKEEQCKQEWIVYASQQGKMLAEDGRFEGKFPSESYDKLQDTAAAGISACGSPLTNAVVKIDSKGVLIELGPPKKKET